MTQESDKRGFIILSKGCTVKSWDEIGPTKKWTLLSKQKIMKPSQPTHYPISKLQEKKS